MRNACWKQNNDIIPYFYYRVNIRYQRYYKTQMAEERQSQYTREERFIYPIRAIKTFSTDVVGMSPFFDKWMNQNLTLINQTSQIAKLAADGTNILEFSLRLKILTFFYTGIVKEGKLLNQENQAQEMANELMQRGNAQEKIRECAVKLYSKNTFLYNVLNTTLRNDDMSKS